MARGDREDKAVEGKDFVWVDMKDSKGNIVKDGTGGAVQTRKFFSKSFPKPEPKTAKPQTSTKSAPKPSAGMKSSPRPKARPAEKPKIVGPVTKAPQVTGKGSGIAGSVGTAVGKGIASMKGAPGKAPNRAEAYKSQTNPDAKRLKKLREDLAAQKRRSSSKGGMTLRERNQ